jgi:uncharacterized membrane-anchored protein
MSEVVPNAEREFWQPPAVAPPVVVEPAAQSGMIEACDRCETEFIPGSRFCHVCGAERSERTAKHQIADGLRAALAWFRHLEFHNIERWMVSVRQRLGLPTASLVSFFIGLFCLAGAVLVGMIFTVQTTLDWQAVQVWRIEWLLGASASFLAGILLKKSPS